MRQAYKIRWSASIRRTGAEGIDAVVDIVEQSVGRIREVRFLSHLLEAGNTPYPHAHQVNER